MASSGVTVSPECVSAFNDLKLGKSTKWIVYKLSDNQKEVIVEEIGKEEDWEVFREKLINAKSPDGKKGARYAIYDLSYEAEGGAGTRNKIVFIAWSPDDAGIKTKMVYSSSKESLKRALNGVAIEIQANDEEDIEKESVTARAARGGR
ncbi:hypothetical protein AMS68_004161 [Peltaster fructicola]|uniref:Cofilin n=1 Tax=Peltaster fructicola TaxID=286661 RepID=A0A6H0XV85_9PEZI|nr:hypothetical protein AMS68_004161 [Peltaster fructicola]